MTRFLYSRVKERKIMRSHRQLVSILESKMYPKMSDKYIKVSNLSTRRYNLYPVVNRSIMTFYFI